MAGPAPKQLRLTLSDLSNDTLLDVLSDLEFRDKIRAGIVCKRWNNLLKTNPPAGRHWKVDYSVDATLSRPAYMATDNFYVAEDFITDSLRYVTVPAPLLGR
jgi:hypothetical protein